MANLPRLPWIHIWTKPRSTIRSIMAYGANYHLFSLSFFFGLLLSLHLAPSMQGYSLLSVFVFCILIAPVLGVIALSICSLGLLFVGKCFGGSASFSQVRASVGWAFIPMFFLLIPYVVLLILLQDLLFSTGGEGIAFQNTDLVALLIYSLLQNILGLWSLILLVISFAEVQHFSIWKSILSVFLLVFLSIGFLVCVI